MTLTARIKQRRRLWLIGFSPGWLVFGALIVGAPSLFYLQQWPWLPIVMFTYAVVVSFHVVTFTTSQPSTFSYYVGVFRECRAELTSLDLQAVVGDDDALIRRADHIQVGPGMGVAVFPCCHPAKMIDWILARIAPEEVPTATMLTRRDDL